MKIPLFSGSFFFLWDVLRLKPIKSDLVSDAEITSEPPKIIELIIDETPFDLWDSIRSELTLKIPQDYARG